MNLNLQISQIFLLMIIQCFLNSFHLIHMDFLTTLMHIFWIYQVTEISIYLIKQDELLDFNPYGIYRSCSVDGVLGVTSMQYVILKYNIFCNDRDL